MTSRYRVEYALRVHRRDEFIEWIKGLLAGPFVLHAGNVSNRARATAGKDTKVAADARRRYAEVFYDVERLVEDKIALDRAVVRSGEHHVHPVLRLAQLVPLVGEFFTRLPLEQAFYVIDHRRSISDRRLVAPLFNDIRLVLNTAQVIALASAEGSKRLRLVTFDGDITLYEDGKLLQRDSPCVLRLVGLLAHDMYVAVVTAAGYADVLGERYHQRLQGLMEAVHELTLLLVDQKQRLLVMGGESNFLFRYSQAAGSLEYIDPPLWQLAEVGLWLELDMMHTLDFAETLLNTMIVQLQLPAFVLRKERLVGLVPREGHSMCREQLEEVVLTCQRRLERLPSALRIKFCAFNGGSDVWVDIGDKLLGVELIQAYLGAMEGDGPIAKGQTLHVGDQFALVGANDYKARLSACTVWIANPHETVSILDDLLGYVDDGVGSE